uniref:Uncharacterized protein n=1 Tax=Arundo donax TaxID=35708 RepID=A0A0A9FSV1_ARUDO
MANTKINQWVVEVQHEYKSTPAGLLQLNRNVRSHLHEYNDETLRKFCIVNGPICSWTWRRCYTWNKSSKALTFKTSSASCPAAK